jgi:hypothetical protein
LMRKSGAIPARSRHCHRSAGQSPEPAREPETLAAVTTIRGADPE